MVWALEELLGRVVVREVGVGVVVEEVQWEVGEGVEGESLQSH